MAAVPKSAFSYPLATIQLALPPELYETLNYVYFLHSLAVHPENVLPPGKSLLSVLSKPPKHEHPQSELRKRVETIVHQAYWDEALESLANPASSVQVSRLKQLFEDVRTAVIALLPEGHQVLTTLTLPLPPTSFPLRSALDPLREVLKAIRERCAPIHDECVDHLQSLLEDPPDSDLPKTIVEASRRLLQLSEGMKEDLAQFVLGTMGEEQLREAVVHEAQNREKEFVLKVWDSKHVHESWRRWLDELPTSTSEPPSGKTRFVNRLFQALGINQATSCSLPASLVSVQSADEASPGQSTPPSNALPPALFFIAPTILYIQNYLQALVITASLRALVRLPSAQPISPDPSSGPELGFEERVWTLLKAEIDEEPSADGTKLVNLADEVVRITRLYNEGSLDSTEESRLRTAVDRTLQADDPVFVLLQKRLLQGIQAHILQAAPDPSNSSQNARSAGPKHMQSGRHAPGVRRTMRTKDQQGLDEHAAEVPAIRGFEHPIVASAVTHATSLLRACINWSERVWTDLIIT